LVLKMTLATRPHMELVRLGKSGLKVSRVVLGMMTSGDPRSQGWELGEEEGIANVKAAYEMGIQTFDTANVYSNGMSEIILGKAVKQLELPREDIVVITKLSSIVGQSSDRPPSPSDEQVALDNGYVHKFGSTRKHIFESVKRSLKRLQLGYIDVLQCHRLDPNTLMAETMHALHDLVQAGYVRHIGMSNCYAWQFHAMQTYAMANKLTPFVPMQNYYDAAYREEEERNMMPAIEMRVWEVKPTRRRRVVERDL